VKHALLKGKPFRSLKDVLWHHEESLGTKGYTVDEVHKLLAEFSKVEVTPLLTVGDTNHMPKWLKRRLPHTLGFFLGIRAKV
jgi:hypothetical protein